MNNSQKSDHTNEKVDLNHSSDSDSLFELQLSPDYETVPIISYPDASHSDKSLFDESSDSNSESRKSINEKLNKNVVTSSRKRKISDDFIASSQEDNKILHSSTRKNKENNRKTNDWHTCTPSKRSNIEIDAESDVDSQCIQIEELDIIDVCKDRKLFETFLSEAQVQRMLSASVACSEINITKAAIGSNIIGQKKTRQPKSTSEVVELKYKNTKMDGLAISWGGNVVYYINLIDGDISQAEKLHLIQSSIFGNMKTIRMFDAKEQIKLLKLCCNLRMDCLVEDPKVADWMLQPEEKEKSLLAMVILK